MTDDLTQYATAELEQVAQCFAHWRHTRTHRCAPIPPPLWEQAVALATRLPLLQVAKRLGLKSATFKHRCGVSPEDATPVRAPSPLHFVDVTPSWPRTGPPQATEIELQRADGTRLRLTCREPSFPVVTLIQTFLETRSWCS